MPMSEFVLDVTVDGEGPPLLRARRRRHPVRGAAPRSATSSRVASPVVRRRSRCSWSRTSTCSRPPGGDRGRPRGCLRRGDGVLVRSQAQGDEARDRSREALHLKDEILAAYLNTVFFADNTYGIQAAAQRYLGVEAKDLTLAQVASLLRDRAVPERARARQPGELRGQHGAARLYPERDARRGPHHAGAVRRGGRWPSVDDAFLQPAAPGQRLPRRAWATRSGPCDYVVKNVPNMTRSPARPPKSARPTGRLAATSSTPRWILDVQSVRAAPGLRERAERRQYRNLPRAMQVSVQPGTGRC